jgi:hypothetical protein
MTKHSTFWEKVDQTDSCWVWKASRDRYGYGQLTYQGRHRMAHHIAYELIKGRIPADLCVLHSCDNPSCVNPDHLYVGTRKQNTQDMMQRGRDKHGQLCGSSNATAKLTENDVRTIRWMHENGTLTNQAIAEYFGVTGALIGMIIKRKIWKHI